MPLCYRPYFDISYFIFKYKIKHRYNGNCKFSNTIIEEKNTASYLEFTNEYIIGSKTIINIADFINKGYFGSRNKLCNEPDCLIENIGNVVILDTISLNIR